MPRLVMPLEDRLWSRLEKMPSGCWEYRGGTHTEKGYGRISAGPGRMLRTHRLAYELVHGPIPDGLIVMHSCDNPPCCNPEHLSVGTHADNVADKVAKGRSNKGRRINMRRGVDRWANGQVPRRVAQEGV